MSDRFAGTFLPSLCGLCELERDSRLWSFASEASSTGNREILAVGCGAMDTLLALCVGCLNSAATETDFLPAAGLTCFVGCCMLRRVRRAGPECSTSMLVQV
jgi:hypothetical protein